MSMKAILMSVLLVVIVGAGGVYGVVCGRGRNPTVRADLIRGARSIS